MNTFEIFRMGLCSFNVDTSVYQSFCQIQDILQVQDILSNSEEDVQPVRLAVTCRK